MGWRAENMRRVNLRRGREARQRVLDALQRLEKASAATLADELGLGRQTVDRHLQHLLEQGAVTFDYFYGTRPNTGRPGWEHWRTWWVVQ